MLEKLILNFLDIVTDLAHVDMLWVDPLHVTAV